MISQSVEESLAILPELSGVYSVCVGIDFDNVAVNGVSVLVSDDDGSKYVSFSGLVIRINKSSFNSLH